MGKPPKFNKHQEKLNQKRNRLNESRKAAAAEKGNQPAVGEKRGRDVAVKNPPTPEAPAKKRYKARLPQSLKEIRKYQRTGALLIRRLPFNRVIREITSKLTGRDDIR